MAINTITGYDINRDESGEKKNCSSIVQLVPCSINNIKLIENMRNNVDENDSFLASMYYY